MEHDRPEPRATEDQRIPLALPPELAEFLAPHPIACLLHATDAGETIFVIKAPAEEVAHVQGRVPILLTHELYRHRLAPVIRTVLRIYDQPQMPLALETFTNIADPEQRADFSALARQNALHLLFYDEQLVHRLSKTVPHRSQAAIGAVIRVADTLLAKIPVQRLDFDQAKADVLQRTRL